VLRQLAANPNGSLAAPVATSAAALYGLWLLLTGGWALFYALALVGVGIGAWQVCEQRRALLLIVLWLVITPGVLLAVNATLLPVYQVRYALAALPAWGLLLGFGVAALARLPLGTYLAPLLVGGMLAGQMANAGAMLPLKPDYNTAVANVAVARNPLEPLLSDIAHRDPVHYYSRQHALTAGLNVDLSWRDHTADEIRERVMALANSRVVWLVMPVNVAKTWHAAAAMTAQGRIVTYHDNVENMVFYRFAYPEADTAPRKPLNFTFIRPDAHAVPIAAYTGALGADVLASPGERVCITPALDVYGTTDYALSLTLVRGYNAVIAQANAPITAGQMCVTVPPDASPGEHHLYLTIYDTETGERAPVMQGDVWWGWWVVVGRLTVAG